MTTRIYAVKNFTRPADRPRLVRAASSSAARNHVARDTLDVSVASQETIYDSAAAGVKIEVAGAESEPVAPSTAGVAE